MHKLSDVDVENRTAICVECGPTRIGSRGVGKFGCITMQHKREKARSPQKKRDQFLSKYGISKEDVEYMKRKQKYKCKICKKKKPLCVDHDHVTGKVRGLLCTSCNLGIGLLGDTKASVLRAYLYLR